MALFASGLWRRGYIIPVTALPSYEARHLSEPGGRYRIEEFATMRLRSAKRFPFWSILVVIAVTTLCGSARAETPGLTGWQEITVLTVSKLEQAVANCGFRLGWKQVSVLLDSAGLTLDEVRRHPRGPDLRRQIDESAAAYREDRTRACAEAWSSFGADAQARDLLLAP